MKVYVLLSITVILASATHGFPTNTNRNPYFGGQFISDIFSLFKSLLQPLNQSRPLSMYLHPMFRHDKIPSKTNLSPPSTTIYNSNRTQPTSENPRNKFYSPTTHNISYRAPSTESSPKNEPKILDFKQERLNYDTKLQSSPTDKVLKRLHDTNQGSVDSKLPRPVVYLSDIPINWSVIGVKPTNSTDSPLYHQVKKHFSFLLPAPTHIQTINTKEVTTSTLSLSSFTTAMSKSGPSSMRSSSLFSSPPRPTTGSSSNSSSSPSTVTSVVPQDVLIGTLLKSPEVNTAAPDPVLGNDLGLRENTIFSQNTKDYKSKSLASTMEQNVLMNAFKGVRKPEPRQEYFVVNDKIPNKLRGGPDLFKAAVKNTLSFDYIPFSKTNVKNENEPILSIFKNSIPNGSKFRSENGAVISMVTQDPLPPEKVFQNKDFIKANINNNVLNNDLLSSLLWKQSISTDSPSYVSEGMGRNPNNDSGLKSLGARRGTLHTTKLMGAPRNEFRQTTKPTPVQEQEVGTTPFPFMGTTAGPFTWLNNFFAAMTPPTSPFNFLG